MHVVLMELSVLIETFIILSALQKWNIVKHNKVG